MLDEGSTITLIDKDKAHSVGIRGTEFSLSLKGIGTNEIIKVASERVKFSLERNTGRVFLINGTAVEKLALPSQSLSNNIVESCRENLGIEISYYLKAVPKILLGQDNWEIIVTKQYGSIPNYPLAISRTDLGWCIHGPVKSELREKLISGENIS